MLNLEERIEIEPTVMSYDDKKAHIIVGSEWIDVTGLFSLEVRERMLETNQRKKLVKMSDLLGAIIEQIRSDMLYLIDDAKTDIRDYIITNR